MATTSTQNNFETSKWYFLCDGDIHFGCKLDPNPRTIKSHRVEDIRAITEIKSKKPELLLCVGDLTDHGADGYHIGKYVCEPDPCVDELYYYIFYYEQPIENAGVPVKLCIGNHDLNRGLYPKLSICKYIRDKHHATYSWWNPMKSSCYTFTHKNILFICLGVYPHDLDWLKKNLPEDKTKPIIIYYHYNTVTGEPYADWWSEQTKETFYNIIKDYHVILIINGHIHISRNQLWKNIPNILCGNEMVSVEINGQDISRIEILD